MNTDNHTVQFCCGTTCDAKGNLAYVKKLERQVELRGKALARNASIIKGLESELAAAQRTIRLLHRKVERRDKLLDEQDEVINGLTKGDTQGAT